MDSPGRARRHDLSVDGAQGTSDVDIDIRHHVAAHRAPVILTFQKFGTNSGGATFPMVLGDTAHLTLRRDHYLIAALVVDLPRTPGARPTLQGVGWTGEWVADNHVRNVAITTRHPTEELVAELGLTTSDGTCPFILAAPYAAPVEPSPFLNRAVPEAPPTPGFAGRRPRRQLGPSGMFSDALTADRRCRARTEWWNARCAMPPVHDDLCLRHWHEVMIGRRVLDHETGEQLRFRPLGE